MLFDSVQIGAADPIEAARQYRLLLGVGGEGRRFDLQRGAVEIVDGEPGLRSLRFRPEPGAAEWPSGAETYNGIPVLLDGSLALAPAAAVASDVPHAIDHVVIQSPDLDRAVALWRDRLGVRLALDREFPQRGIRILFFRSAGVTLEFSGALAAAVDGPDRLWGIAYQVADLGACRRRLLASDVAVSEARPGHKAGTWVATVKSHDLGIPTLLIQPSS